jgi:hypothetical protein
MKGGVKMYEVVVKLDNDSTDRFAIKASTLQNAVSRVTGNVWIKCDETDRYFNMNKVVYFYVTKLD